MQRRIILVDIGGVIIDRKNPRGEHSYQKGDPRFSPQIPGAFEGIKQLKKQGEDLRFCSKAREEYQSMDKAWFLFNCFEKITGITLDSSNLNYVSERYMKRIFADRIGATDVIDNRFTQIQHLAEVESVQRLFLLNPDESDLIHCATAAFPVTPVIGWEALVNAHFRRGELDIPSQVPILTPTPTNALA